MITAVQAAAALALLYFGGEALVRGASALALRAGISALAVGLTVVAFGTSAPELVVSVDAALSGAADISLGNVVGSNVANVALILGLAALIRPIAVEAKVVRFDAPLMLVVSTALLALLLDGELSRLEGWLLISGLAGYTAFTLWQSRRESRRVRRELASAAPQSIVRPTVGGLLVLVGFAMLIGGGHLLVEAAITLAVRLGVSQAAIGLTIVAVGTSLPELATSVVASLRGQGDIAVGNVVGSNLFNILGILGVAGVLRPLERGGVTWVDLAVMVLAAVVLTALLALRRRMGRVAGATFLVGFLLYAAHLLAG